MPLPDALAHLQLSPHPEGGFYRETHRSPLCTVIDFVLLPGQHSTLHRVRGREEVWVHHSGGPLGLHVLHEGLAHHVVLDSTHASHVVPSGAWQAAEPAGDEWVWVTCIVAPPFHFEHFDMAPGDLPVPDTLRHLLLKAP